MVRPEKASRVQELASHIKDSPGVYLVDFARINARELGSLRRELRKSHLRLKVVKNTLAARALGAICPLPAGNWQDLLVGQSALVVGPADYLEAARLLFHLTRKVTNLHVRAAYVEGRLLASQEFEYLARLPTRPVLIGQVAASLLAPLSGVVLALLYRIYDLVFVLDETARKKEVQ